MQLKASLFLPFVLFFRDGVPVLHVCTCTGYCCLIKFLLQTECRMGLSLRVLFSHPIILECDVSFCDMAMLNEAFLSLFAVQNDLASEGLLLIRVQPDERGGYGFNVRVVYIR